MDRDCPSNTVPYYFYDVIGRDLLLSQKQDFLLLEVEFASVWNLGLHERFVVNYSQSLMAVGAMPDIFSFGFLFWYYDHL